MSNKKTALTAASLTNLPTTEVAVDLEGFGSGNTFLGRLQLVSKGKYVDLKKLDAGNYGIPGSGDEIEDLGPSVNILPLAARNKALDMNGEKPLSVFDSASPLYQEIVERSKQPNSGCMWGPSVLVFEQTSGRFLELFLGSASGREEAGKLKPFLPINESQAKAAGVKAKGPTPVTLNSKYVKQGRFSWYVPVVGQCSSEIELPALEQVVSEIDSFINAKGGENVEVAATAGRSR